METSPLHYFAGMEQWRHHLSIILEGTLRMVHVGEATCHRITARHLGFRSPLPPSIKNSDRKNGQSRIGAGDLSLYSSTRYPPGHCDSSTTAVLRNALN